MNPIAWVDDLLAELHRLVPPCGPARHRISRLENGHLAVLVFEGTKWMSVMFDPGDEAREPESLAADIAKLLKMEDAGLTRERFDLVELVIANAYRLYASSVCGCNAPETKRLFDEVSEPKVGDLVVETSTIAFPERDRARFGRLVKQERVPLEPVEEYEGATELVSSVRHPDGSVTNWRNAGFVKVVETRFDWTEGGVR